MATSTIDGAAPAGPPSPAIGPDANGAGPRSTTTAAATAARTGGDTLRRRELAAFLRSRRERISPEQVGIALTGRRRTPGLRREEIAQLSGVGVTWYTWLEQGRDIHVSEQVLTALARTLMLTAAERSHLFTLAVGTDVEAVRECNAVPDNVRRMLDHLDPYPACVQSARYDVLAYNRAYANLIVDFDALEPQDRNCAWLMFTHPAWREVIVDWEDAATRTVGNLRSLMPEHMGDAQWKTLIARLTAESPEFVEMWSQHEVRPIETKVKRFRHPRAGLLAFHGTNSWLAPRAGTRLLTYVPADERTEQSLHLLVAAAGAA